MRTILIKAIKRCGRNKPGEEFLANSVEAKALVGIGHAELVKSPAAKDEQSDEPKLPPVSEFVQGLAAEHGIDLSAITGSGQAGRITRKDVEAAIAAKPVTNQE